MLVHYSSGNLPTILKEEVYVCYTTLLVKYSHVITLFLHEIVGFFYKDVEYQRLVSGHMFYCRLNYNFLCSHILKWNIFICTFYFHLEFSAVLWKFRRTVYFINQISFRITLTAIQLILYFPSGHQFWIHFTEKRWVKNWGVYGKTGEWMDWLFIVLRPTQEYFTYMNMSPIMVKGCKT
jgi:hypothetical protein